MPPVERPAYAQAVADARTHLGEHPFAAVWSEGTGMTPEQALTTLGQPSQPVQSPPVSRSRARKLAASAPAGLTPRQLEVLCLLAQGRTNPEIAELLMIGESTVNSHVTAIFDKLNVNSRSEATLWAARHHLV